MGQFRFMASGTGLVMGFASTMVFAENTYIEQFDKAPVSGWHVANFVFSHPHFDTDWSRQQVTVNKGLTLSLSPQEEKENRFSGASIRREKTTHYGRYEVMIQPSPEAGVVTGFFTYTGSYYGTRHDEIDIEFLGKDTTKLHAAWFVDGQLQNRLIDLGFDAADRPRLYVFDWLPDRIRWYAEGQLIFEVTTSESLIPSTPGYLFANIWAAESTLNSWSGTPKPETDTSAFVRSIQFTPLSQMQDQTS